MLGILKISCKGLSVCFRGGNQSFPQNLRIENITPSLASIIHVPNSYSMFTSAQILLIFLLLSYMIKKVYLSFGIDFIRNVFQVEYLLLFFFFPRPHHELFLVFIPEKRRLLSCRTLSKLFATLIYKMFSLENILSLLILAHYIYLDCISHVRDNHGAY